MKPSSLRKLDERRFELLESAVAERTQNEFRELIGRLSEAEFHTLRRNCAQERERRNEVHREALLTSVPRLWVDAMRRLLTSPPPGEAVPFGNYRLVPDALPAKPIVYSAGVGRNVTFDEAVADRLGAQVYLFDPTPASVEYMANRPPDPRMQFFPWAVYSRDGTIDLYFEDRQPGQQVFSASAVNLLATKNKFSAPAFSVPTLMQKLGHDRLDVLKMDTEGSALPTLQVALQQGVHPAQILCEFERPIGYTRVRAQADYALRMARVLTALRSLRYDVYCLRHTLKQLEILAVRR